MSGGRRDGNGLSSCDCLNLTDKGQRRTIIVVPLLGHHLQQVLFELAYSSQRFRLERPVMYRTKKKLNSVSVSIVKTTTILSKATITFRYDLLIQFRLAHAPVGTEVGGSASVVRWSIHQRRHKGTRGASRLTPARLQVYGRGRWLAHLNAVHADDPTGNIL